MVEGWLASGWDWSHQGAMGVVQARDFVSSDQADASAHSEEQWLQGTFRMEGWKNFDPALT